MLKNRAEIFVGGRLGGFVTNPRTILPREISPVYIDKRDHSHLGGETRWFRNDAASPISAEVRVRVYRNRGGGRRTIYARRVRSGTHGLRPTTDAPSYTPNSTKSAIRRQTHGFRTGSEAISGPRTAPPMRRGRGNMDFGIPPTLLPNIPSWGSGEIANCAKSAIR